jgi:HK97 family phage major capsid protein
MTTNKQEIQGLLAQAKKALLDGDITKAERLRLEAQIKGDEQRLQSSDTVQRLPFPDTSAPSSGYEAKSFYVSRFGEVDAGVRQVMSELYGTDRTVEDLNYLKLLDLRRYLKHGVCDEQISRMMVLAPQQIELAVKSGVSVREIKATMVESQDTLGGFLVPETWRAEMQQRMVGLTAVRSLAKVSTTSTDSLKLPVRTGGNSRYTGNIRVTMTDESPAGTEAATNATFGEASIPVHTAMAHVTISKNLLEDSGVDLVSELNDEFAEAAAVKEDEQFLVGNGVGQPQGILNGTAANGAPFNADVQAVNSGAAAALTADGIVAMPWKLDGQYRQAKNPSTSWLAAKATYEAMAKLKDGQGRYLWSELNLSGIADANPDRLRGWQWRESEAMPAVAANTYPVIFGDFQGYRIVDRMGMSITRYDDFSTGKSNQVGLVMRRRYGGQVTKGWMFVVLKVAQ